MQRNSALYCLLKTLGKHLTYRDGDLVHGGELGGVVVEVALGEGGRRGQGRLARVGRRLLHAAVALVQVQRLGAHVLGPLLVDQLQHLPGLLLDQRGRRSPAAHRGISTSKQTAQCQK